MHSPRPELLASVVGVAVIVALWANTALRTTQPLVHADEAGYLIHARGFAGLGEFWGNSYHPGYGLLISPLMHVFHDIADVFRGAQVINLGLLILTFCLIVQIVREVVPEGHPLLAPASALAVLAYPSWIGYAALALPECLLLAMATASYRLALDGFDRNKTWALAAGGLLAGLIPLVHPRAVVLTIAWGAAVLLGVALKRVDLRSAALGVLSGAVGAIATLAILSISFIDTPDGGSSGTGFLTRLSELENAIRYPIVIAGHFFYAAAASAGLVPLGWFLVARRAPRSLAAVFISLTAALALLISAAFMLRGLTERGIYGRYAEPFLAAFLAIGLAAIAARRRPWQLAFMMGAVAIPAVAIRLARDAGDWAGSYNRSNVLVLVPLIDWLENIRIGWIALAAVALAAIVWLGTSKVLRVAPGFAVLILTFAALGWVNSRDYFEWGVDQRAQSSKLAPLVLDLHQAATGEDLGCITVDRRSIDQWHRFNYRVLLHRSRVAEQIGPTPAASDCSAWILSTQTDIDERVVGARLVSLEAHAAVGLWALPGSEQDYLDTQDLLFPPSWDGPVPEPARSAAVELVDARRVGDLLIAEVEVRHTGSGSPWPGASGLPQGIDTPVRVAPALVSRHQPGPIHPATRVELPATTAPGTSVRVAVELPWPVDVDEPELSIELVQDGVAWFDGTHRFDLGAID